MAIMSTFKKIALRLRGGHFFPRRPAVFALEVFAGLALCLLLAFGILLWRLSEGPVSLPFLHGQLESIINAELTDAHAEFAKTVILKEKGGGIRLRLVDIKVKSKGGQLLAAAPMAAISMSPWGIITGKTSITRMVLIRPTITLSHGIDGQFSFGIADAFQEPHQADGQAEQPQQNAPEEAKNAKTPPDRKALWSALFKEDQFNLLQKLNISPGSNLAHVGVKDASLIVIDEASGTIVKASNTQLALNRAKSGYTLFASTQFNIKGGLSSLSFTASFEHGGRASVVTRFRDLKPAEFSPLVASAVLRRADLPLSGKASFILDNSGVLLGASADVEAGAGLLKLGNGGSVLVDEADIALHFDSKSDTIAIEQGSVLSGYNQISFSGKVGLIRDARRNVKTFDLSLSSSNIALILDNKSKKPVVFSWGTLKARITPVPLLIEIEKARFGAGKLSLDLVGSVRDAPLSPEVRLQGSGKSIPADVIKRLWPTTLAPGTRAWIGNNLKAGFLRQGAFKIHLPPGEIAKARTGTPIPEDHIQLSFDVENAKFTYLPGLPPIEKASGRGLLSGNQLLIKLAKGRIKAPSGGQVLVSDGNFAIPRIHEDVTLGNTNGYVDLKLAGKTKAILEILDMKPLGYVSMMSLKPASVGGASTGRLNLSMPLVRDLTLERISIKAKVSLKDTKIRQIYKGVDLNNGNLVINVNNKGLVAKGKIALNTVPFTLKWNESFKQGKKFTTRFELGGRLDAKTRKALGIDIKHLLRGPADIKLVSHGNRGEITSTHIEANLKRSELRQDDIRWKKPAGVPAKAVFDIDYTKKGHIRIGKLGVTGKNLKISGAARFDQKGNLVKLDLGHVQLGRSTRFSLTGKRGKSGILHLKAKGKRFDARPLLKNLMAASAPAAPRKGGSEAANMTFNGAFGEILMLNRVKLRKASVKLHSVRDLMERFSLKGVLDGKLPLSVDVSRKNKTTRNLKISTRNGGALLRGTDFYTRITKGTLNLSALMKNPGGTMSGKIRISDFGITGEPALKSLIKSSNPKSKKRGGDSVLFDKLKVEFDRIPGVLTIKNGIIAGPSIGATARGRINHVNHTLQIAGTLVPIYGLNAAFGKIPVLGRFLAGRKGEGLFGITFGIQGPIKRPVFTMNPASALAPGFLRILFEFKSGVKSPTFKAPSSLND